EDSDSGHVELQPSYGSYPGGGIRSDDFTIPTVPRPYAEVDVLSTGVAAGCTQRPGFLVIALTVRISTHDGASELTLGSPMSLVADGARYLPTYCYPVADSCDYRIGLPVDGAATCSLFFELPDTAAVAVLELDDLRYPASRDFT